MTRLQLLRSLYESGFVLQLGHKRHGLYPLRWLGRLLLRRLYRHNGKKKREKMNCTACLKRGGKTWEGDDPVCAFPDNGEFIAENWNCATVDFIRDIVYEGQDLPDWVDYQYCDDQKFATINIDGMEVGLIEGHPLALWISWYKSRGGTDAMWLLFDDIPPRLPTAKECVAIAKYCLGERRK